MRLKYVHAKKESLTAKTQRREEKKEGKNLFRAVRRKKFSNEGALSGLENLGP